MTHDLPIDNLTMDEWYERNLDFLQSQFRANRPEDFQIREQYIEIERHPEFDEWLEEQYDEQVAKEHAVCAA